MSQQSDSVSSVASAQSAPAAMAFLTLLLGGDQVSTGQLLLFTKAGSTTAGHNRSAFFTRVADAATHAMRESTTREVYVGVALRRDGLDPTHRGRNDDVVALLGLVADVDVRGPAHADVKQYAATIDDARGMLERVALKPTVIVASGHGLQAWWLFERPWVFADATERERAAAVSKGWHKYLAGLAATHGFEIDAVHDLARILRVPGTLNHKLPPAVPVRILTQDGPRHTPDDFTAVVPPTPATMTSPSDTTPNDTPMPLVLLAGAEPPSEKFQELYTSSERFRLSWDRARPEFKDKSPSAYDMSLAALAKRRGWTDQEIVDLLIANRRRHGDDLKLREDYYATTIERAGTLQAAPPSELRADRGSVDDEATGTKTTGRTMSQIQALLKIADAAEVFRTPAGAPHATFPVDDHRETSVIGTRGGTRFRRWLGWRSMAESGRPPSAQAVQDTLHALEARATFGSVVHDVQTRIALHEGKIYLDLANDRWECVEIRPDGWSIISAPPVRFRRHHELAPLPHPDRLGDLTLLRDLVNVANNDDWILLASYIVGTIGCLPSFPVLVVTGEQGSAKSTLGRILKALIDPAHRAPTRSLPRTEEDLVIAAQDTHVLVFSNISSIADPMSDALCRLASGEGFGKRKKYTDDDEIVFGAARPVVLNGIGDYAARGDLLDRSILLNLPTIDAKERRTERELWIELAHTAPKILGALCNAAVVGLRNHAVTKLTWVPRMADFAQWVVACEPALPWNAGAFLSAYQQNRASTVQDPLEHSIVTDEFLVWANVNVLSTQPVEIQANALLQALNAHFHDDERRILSEPKWPKTPAQLSQELRRLAPALRQAGFELTSGKTPNGRHRFIRIARI